MANKGKGKDLWNGSRNHGRDDAVRPTLVLKNQAYDCSRRPYQQPYRQQA